MANTPVSRKSVIDLIVLAFVHSAVKDLVGTDALRSVLEVRYRSMTQDGDLNLEPLWSLLCDQPGFDQAAATPAVSKLKSFESQLGMAVRLPEAMAGLDDATIQEWASTVDIPAHLVQAALKGSEPAGKPRTTARSKKVTDLIEAAVETESKPDPKSKKRGPRLADRLRGWEIPLAIVGVLGLGVAGYSFHGFACSQAQFRAVNVDFGEIPVKQIQQLGDQIGAVLADEAWLALPKDTRKEQLAQVLSSLAGDSVRAVFVMSPKREVYALARYRVGTDNISYHFNR